ncbi:MAG: L-xylulokinase [Micromonosporaceae bacterium]
MTHLLGVDAGQTVTKAALFDLSGRELAVASAGTRTVSPHPRWQERDMDEAWTQTAQAIRRCLADASVDPASVLAVGLCGHNDGMHLVDARGRPVRPAILATDSRAYLQAERMRAGERGTRSLELTGQVPVAYSPAPLLAWLREYEPRALDRAAHLLFCKDWLRLRLTGQLATDPSEASAFCTDLHTQTWSTDALELFGLADLARLLPPIVDSAAVAGTVTPEAAQLTGLRAGTQVVTGAHDVDAAALGIGAVAPGSLSIVMGTFSINQVVAPQPVADARWQARTFLRPAQWLHMSTSPSSAANLEWAVRQFGPWDPAGLPAHELAIAQAAGATGNTPVYLPFLYGSPYGPGIGAAFAGLRGWHTRGHLIRAVLEGVVFNHRWHTDALGERFAVRQRPARLCGGGSRSPLWSQLLADALGTPVEVTDATEAGSRGAAVLAGVGAKVYADLDDAAAATVRVVRAHEPDPSAVERLDAGYARYRRVVDALVEVEDGP